MKTLLIVAILIMGIASVASAMELEVKLCPMYNLDDNKVEEAIGTAVKKDLFVKGLDIDFFIASERGETLTSDEKNGIVGLSYNYDINDKLGVLVGAGLGAKDFLDIQKIRDDNNIEIDKYIYAGLSYRF